MRKFVQNRLRRRQQCLLFRSGLKRGQWLKKPPPAGGFRHVPLPDSDRGRPPPSERNTHAPDPADGSGRIGAARSALYDSSMAQLRRRDLLDCDAAPSALDIARKRMLDKHARGRDRRAPSEPRIRYAKIISFCLWIFTVSPPASKWDERPEGHGRASSARRPPERTPTRYVWSIDTKMMKALMRALNAREQGHVEPPLPEIARGQPGQVFRRAHPRVCGG